MELIGMKSNMDKLIKMEKEKRESLTGGRVTIGKIVNEIADFCKVNRESILAYKDNKAIPSLPIALKLEEYFHVSISNIFIITDYELAMNNRAKKGRRPSENQECSYGECKGKLYARGMCSRHYQQWKNGKIRID